MSILTSKKEVPLTMSLRGLAQSIVVRARRLAVGARKILPDARRAARKPKAIGCILMTARQAQITLAIVLIVLIFFAPTLAELLAGTVFPPETSKKVFGLIKTQQANPSKGVAEAVLMTTLWTISIGYSLLLFWLHIPHGLARANARSLSLLAAGDGNDDMIKSLALYKRAYAIATDPDLESRLETRLKAAASLSVSDSHDGATKIDSCQNALIGSDTSACTSQPSSQKEESRFHVGPEGRYTLGTELGRGAMGVVFRAWDKVLDREVAVKQLSLVLAGDDEYASRFRREARALARLTHSNVVQVYDLVEEADRLWMILEFVDGGDLATCLKARDRLTVSEAMNIIIPVAEGLAFAHNQGIIHRDLKPANILLTREHKPKISDFGIARLSQSSTLTQVGSVLGSPPYMSPEQCSGSAVDTRTDVYALGITLYELLTGKAPFEGDTASVMARQIIEQPAPLSEVLEDIPADLEGLILRMLAKSPDERPLDMTVVIDLLSPFKDDIASQKRSQLSQPTV